VNISIFGLGYVGVVSAACLSSLGHKIVGVDVHESKVDLINKGTAPVIEARLPELIKENVAQGRIVATMNPEEAVRETELSLICVGTPSRPNGSLNLEHVFNVCRQIGDALASKSSYHAVALRSTALPGTSSEMLEVLTSKSGKTAPEEIGVCYNPEFLREGSAVDDFYHPPFTVIGAEDNKVAELLERCYREIEAPVRRLPLKASELIKYASNSFHALKVAFANEVGSICKAMDIDSRILMKLFIEDDKLNTSGAYLMPGFAYGGSCLPKDVRALAYHAKERDIEVPVISSIQDSNAGHVARGLDLVMADGRKQVGIAGLSFKGGTDDIRESPVLGLAETLLGKGYPLRIYDRNINLSALVGANREFLERKIPHITAIMVDTLEELVAFSEVIVIGNNDKDLDRLPALTPDSARIIDLVGISGEARNKLKARYDGICW